MHSTVFSRICDNPSAEKIRNDNRNATIMLERIERPVSKKHHQPYRLLSVPSFLLDRTSTPLSDAINNPRKVTKRLSQRQWSKSTVDTCSSSTSDPEDDIFLTNSYSLRDLSSTYCRKCGQGHVSTDTNVEMTLMDAGSVVTMCSCLKSNDMERSVLEKESLPDLTSSGAQLSAMGEYEASLLRYQMTLESLQRQCESSPTKVTRQQFYQLANLCYTCGQLSRKLHDYKAAAKYFEHELRYTKEFTSSTKNINSPSNDLCLAKCYDGLAKLNQYDMGETETALEYYQHALKLEKSALEKLLSIHCGKCNNHTTAQTSANDDHARSVQTVDEYEKLYRHRPCRHIASFVSNLQYQIEETKMNIGRIHFQNGHLDQALDLTIQRMKVMLPVK